MSHLLTALQAIEERRKESDAPPAAVDTHTQTEPVVVASPPPRVPDSANPRRFNAFEVCSLPTVSGRINEGYLELARTVSEQGAANYCNVLFFAACDPSILPAFSMISLAHAFATYSPGNLLLVDGDLRRARLSEQVWPSGGGLIEAMQGTATWPDVIHPTTSPRIDFVSRGTGPIPTLERAQFGWGALRPKYRAVLIGLGAVEEPESAWLASRCDAVYVVVSRSRTRRPTAKTAVRRLAENGASVLGCIVLDD